MTKQAKKVEAFEPFTNSKGIESVAGSSFWGVFENGKMINDEFYDAKWVAEISNGLYED